VGTIELRWFLPLFALGLGLSAAGCPGTLEDPERFGCTLDVKKDILSATCGASICHDSTTPAGGLDLASAGVEGRLVGKPPLCEECTAGECTGKLLIDPKNPEQSYLLEKVHDLSPACGDRMPLGLKLSAEKLNCLEKWVETTAKSGGGGSSGSGGSGGTEAGSGGSAGTSSDAAAGAAGSGDGG
jgi:hypothetical protein